MPRAAQLAAKIVAIVLLSGFLGAVLVRFSPGYGADEAELDSRLNQQSIEAIRQANAGEKNLLAYYFQSIWRMAHGDLGISRTLQRPVVELLRERLPETLMSVGLSLAVAWTLGLSLAMLIVLARSWYLDLAASLMAGFLLCLPAAVLALVAVLAHAPARLLLALVVFPKVLRYSRNLLGRAANLPHVLTARAKGLGSLRVLFWHILPVAGPQLLALSGVTVSLAFAAAIPIEALCDLPGVGQLAWKAALGRDVPLLVNLTMIVTLVTVLANSASDAMGQGFRRAEA